MRTRIGRVAAASLPLLLSAAGALASESQFQTPATERAQQTQALLTRAAHAVSTRVTRTGGEHLADLWLFPTASTDTVFAQYVVSTNGSSLKSESAGPHFELLRMKGERIVEQRDLTHARDDSTTTAKRSSAVPDWSASIGTGHVTDGAKRPTVSTGSPSAPHWSASIGAGQALDSTRAADASAGSPASAHWTAAIGTGHVSTDPGRRYLANTNTLASQSSRVN